MSKTMTFAALVHKGLAEIKHRPIPELLPHEVLVRNEACNICTTDYQQWMGLREHQGYPMVGGHENCGYIEAVGSEVTTVKVGDFVAPYGSYKGCGRCEHCLKGELLQCGDSQPKLISEEGYLGEFGFSTHQIWDEKYVIKMNKDLDPGCACFLEPLATVLKGQEKLRIEVSDTVVVIGGGTMGILNGLAAKAAGARVIISEMFEKKLAVAKAYGLETINPKECDPIEKVKELTDGKGADIIIVAVGVQAANDQALKMVKEVDGKVLYFAAAYPSPNITISSNEVHYRRLELIGTYGADFKNFLNSSKLLNNKIIDPSKIVEAERYPLTKMQDAFAAAATVGMYRVCVKCQE